MKNWSKGDRVAQPTYGAGTLVEVNEHHTVIDFDEHGRKVFATRLVVLQASNEPAPHKAAVRKRAVKKRKLKVKREKSKPEIRCTLLKPRSGLVPPWVFFLAFDFNF
jgi:hypothetical protein